jgi:hypothetical protein
MPRITTDEHTYAAIAPTVSTAIAPVTLEYIAGYWYSR